MNRQRDPAALEETYDYWELRAYLGVDVDHYKDFKLFKRKVLKPLMDAVNERTDLYLTYEPVKTGRKLSHLKFTVRSQSWQLGLFEAEHAARLVEELAKTFDGAVIASKSQPAQIETTTDKQAGLIDQCVKVGVTSKTVERALAAHGVQGVEEIIAFTNAKLAKMDAKGESYDRANYVARMLNDGVGVKAPAVRKKEAAAKRKLAERAAAKEAQTAAERAEEKRQARFSEYQKNRAHELIAQQGFKELAELGAIVAEALPEVANYRRRWQDVGQNPAKLDHGKATDKTIYGAYVVPEALKMWGTPADMDLNAFN